MIAQHLGSIYLTLVGLAAAGFAVAVCRRSKGVGEITKSFRRYGDG